MILEEFNEILNLQIAKVKDILTSKGKEYALSEDRLSQFKDIAKMQGTIPEKALLHLCDKHYQSLRDMIDSQERKQGRIPNGIWDAKITDIMNYMVLLKALQSEQRCQH